MMHKKLDYLFILSFIYFIVFHISILFVYLITHLDRMLTRLAYSMSRVVIKPAFCICENKDADQLRGNREPDQRLCFRYTDSTVPLLPESEMSSL